MFYNLPSIKRLMKHEYKGSGLTVGMTDNEWLYIAGSFWILCQDFKSVPKEFKAAVIELAGEFPEPGNCIRAFKDGGNQIMIEQDDFLMLPYKYTDISVRGIRCNETEIVLLWLHPVRIIEPQLGQPLRVIREDALSVVSRDSIDHDAGETDILGPFVKNDDPIVIWFNDSTWYGVYPINPGEDNPKADILNMIAGAFGTTAYTPRKHEIIEEEDENVEGHSETV